MTMIKSGDNFKIQMEVAEDCVVFSAHCLCHDIRKHAVVMIEKTKEVGMNKMVIVGDCDSHGQYHDRFLAEAMAGTGVEYIWLSDEGLFIHEVMPTFSEVGVRRFSEAESFGKLRNLLDKIGRKIYDIRQKIGRESKTLAEYPVVAKIETIESHDHNDDYKEVGRAAFNTLFGKPLPSTLVSDVNAVALFNPANATGMLVTKSQEIKFSVADPKYFNLDKLQGRSDTEFGRKGYTRKGCGSIRINLGAGAPQVSLYCLPGVWTVKSHPELDTADPDIHYIPMWQRVEKAQ